MHNPDIRTAVAGHYRTTMAEHYGMDEPVIDALAHITGLFGTTVTARWIVLPYGTSISVPDIAEALNHLYKAGQTAGHKA